MTNKLQLDIPLLLPDIADESDACVKRLTDELKGRAGIEQAHILPASLERRARLCVHFDSDILPVTRLEELIEAAGARLTRRFGHILWQVDGVVYQRRARTLAERISRLDGVLDAGVDVSGTVHIEFDREKTSTAVLGAALYKMGLRRLAPMRQQGGAADGLQDRSVLLDGAASSAVPAQEAAALKIVADTLDSAQPAPDNGVLINAKELVQQSQPLVDKRAKATGPDHDHDHGGPFGAKSELIFSLICGGLLLIGFLTEKLVSMAPDWLSLACYLGAYAFGGYYTLKEAIDNLRMKRFEIDTLMLVAAAGAAALGAWAEGALLLFLFSFGHALEHYAMGRARRAIEALAELTPKTATVIKAGNTVTKAVEDLQIGDIVLVRPNERLAADGFVVEGTSAVNQAPVTGESMAVDKMPVGDVASARARPDKVAAAHRVFAGSINGNAALEIEVTHLSADNTLARVVRMVSEAKTQKSPTQRFTDRFERVFVPMVLILAVVLMFAWVVVDEPFRDSFYRAMAVLVAASPCALAIATPSAVLSGIARAARGGVLIKGGGPLEVLGSVEAIAFDKTGTLTQGQPGIERVVTAEGVTEARFMAVALAVESQSDHPLAQAIVRDGQAYVEAGAALPAVVGVRSLTGKGVIASLDGEDVRIGKPDMFGVDGIPALPAQLDAAIMQMRADGLTIMVVQHGPEALGAIGLLDKPRVEAAGAVKALRSLGISQMIMISGDHQGAADAIAKQVGLDEALGDLMPEDKVATILKLREDSGVAMVGDGVNDAPAMANADVGIAMGAAGSDVALEMADVALMADDLSHLPFAVDLSRRTRAIIRQNLFVSLGIVAILVPATILGLGIGPAVAIHEGSTLLVVFNALRLLAYRDGQQVAVS